MHKPVTPLSRGNARSAAAQRIRQRVVDQHRKKIAQQLHEAYKASTYSPEEKDQLFKQHLEAVVAEDSKLVMRGSLMTAQQRRDYVLDRLVAESRGGNKDTARIRALELIGKTAGLFVDKQDVATNARNSDDIKQRILNLLDSVRGRTIDSTAVQCADDINAERVNSADNAPETAQDDAGSV
jgi:hypothetical protein